MPFRAYNGKVAIWKKPPSGDPMAPFDDPVANIEYVRFHSDLQYLSSVIETGDITKTHTLLAGVTGTGISVGAGNGNSGTAPVANGQIRKSSILLYTHSLGYVPLYMVLLNGTIVVAGTVVQQTSKEIRYVSPYATTTGIYLEEYAISSAADLVAADVTYQVLVFRNPDADPALPTLHLKVSGSNPMVLAKGKVTDENRPLRRAAIDDTNKFYIPTGRVIDIKNGVIRMISPIDGIHDHGSEIYTGGFNSAEAIKVTY